MNRLLASQYSKHGHKTHHCNYCHQIFGKEKILKDHLEYCSKFECGKTVFPEKGKTLKFVNFERIHDIPFVIFADFECYLIPVNNKIGKNTKQFQKHEASGFCYLIICFDNNIYKPKMVFYTKKSEDEDIGKIFVESLEKDVKEIYNKFKFPKRMIFGDEDKKDFKHAEKCYACGKEFKDAKEKVRDHCHYTGKYRGAACVSCNSKMKNPKFIPVVFHNLQNYDSHLFIKNLGFTEGNINCIPKTDEKYISFSKDIIVDEFFSKKTLKNVFVKRQLRFIDSYKFMSISLEKLVANLEKDDLKILKLFFENEEDRKLLSRK